MEKLVLVRAIYGKPGVPFDRREFSETGSCPVGNAGDWILYASKGPFRFDMIEFRDPVEKNVSVYSLVSGKWIEKEKPKKRF